MSNAVEELSDGDLLELMRAPEPPRNSGFLADDKKLGEVFDLICSAKNTSTLLKRQVTEENQ